MSNRKGQSPGQFLGEEIAKLEIICLSLNETIVKQRKQSQRDEITITNLKEKETSKKETIEKQKATIKKLKAELKISKAMKAMKSTKAK